MQKSNAKLIDQLSWAMGVKHYSLRTEKSYVPWVRRYIFYHKKRHPQGDGSQRGTIVSELSGCESEGICFDSETSPECPHTDQPGNERTQQRGKPEQSEFALQV